MKSTTVTVSYFVLNYLCENVSYTLRKYGGKCTNKKIDYKKIDECKMEWKTIYSQFWLRTTINANIFKKSKKISFHVLYREKGQIELIDWIVLCKQLWVENLVTLYHGCSKSEKKTFVSIATVQYDHYHYHYYCT